MGHAFSVRFLYYLLSAGPSDAAAIERVTPSASFSSTIIRAVRLKEIGIKGLTEIRIMRIISLRERYRRHNYSHYSNFC